MFWKVAHYFLLSAKLKLTNDSKNDMKNFDSSYHLLFTWYFKFDLLSLSLSLSLFLHAMK